MAEKQNHKERLKEITDSIETGRMERYESDKHKNYPQIFCRITLQPHAGAWYTVFTTKYWYISGDTIITSHSK